MGGKGEGEKGRVETFWGEFLRSDGALLVNAPAETPDAWGFGDSPEMADQLGRLVYDGVKTATCSALWDYEHDGEELPKVGELSIVLDGADRPLCIVEVTDVQIKPFNQVDADFAHAEGEGDRTLAWWREAHWRFFSRVLPNIGRAPEETMPLVCERFRVIYRA
jgi:uncharacterized protein YhfF